MDGGREYNKQNKPFRERQKSYDVIHMWNLRYKSSEKRKKKKREKPRNRLLTIENKLIVAMGGRMGEIGDGIKKGSCHDEYWVMYRMLKYCIVHLKLI